MRAAGLASPARRWYARDMARSRISKNSAAVALGADVLEHCAPATGGDAVHIVGIDPSVVIPFGPVDQGLPNAGGVLAWPVIAQQDPLSSPWVVSGAVSVTQFTVPWATKDSSTSNAGGAVPTDASYIGINVGGNLTGLTAGQAVMASSIPVVLASNQTAVPVTDSPLAVLVATLQVPQTSTTVVPNDTTPVSYTKGLWIGTAGDVTGQLVNDSADRVWKNCPSGSTLWGSFKLVKTTGTTASNLLGYS